MKKRILALILAAVASGIMCLPLPAHAANASTGGFQLSESSIGVGVGDYTKLYAYFGSSVDSNVTWSSADGTIAAVDSGGTVTGKKIGQTVVTARDGAYSSSCVVNVAYKGIDVSRYQGTIDWSAVKNYGIDFAMIRTGYGSENWSVQTDPYFQTYYNSAKAVGLKVGAYHYSYATSVAMAQAEADFCLNILNGQKLDYPVAYDVEDKSQWGLSTDTLGQIVQAFCSKLQAAGYKTVVYSYYSFYNAHLTSSLVAQYDTWIAHSTDRTDFSPYTMWQYGQRTIPGVSGSCDVDYSFYDYSGSGNGSGGITTPTVPDSSEQVFTCDTTNTYTFSSNKTYNYKITTNDTFTPSVSSSNPGAVSVSYLRRLTDGFLFQLTNKGTGEAVITTTAGNGTSVSFTAVGSGTDTTVTTQPANGGTLRCDTTLPYTFGSNSSYVYKVYSNSSAVPTAVSSNPSAVAVSYSGKTSDGYLFRITNAGTGAAVITTADASGVSVSFTANGTLSSQAPSGIQSDTPYQFSMTKGKTYMFKFTPASGTPALRFTTGNSAVIQTVSAVQSGGSYFYKIKAVAAGQAGVYATESGKSSPQRLSIVTVS
ncbi:GH25 family lysozyme [Caproiciproducens sp. NJN-50]|uniref:GH25 family lysozyme n=1 Tax=Caproiciproducens sp. NJN-50 TaxID=2507162 RepID=UPI0013E8B91C|nr:GH25 family lysozyme [Caproiciproducens sp. NJN-50]